MFEKHALKKKGIQEYYLSIPMNSSFVPTEEEEKEYVSAYLASNGYEENPYNVPWDFCIFSTMFLAGAFLVTVGTVSSVVGVGGPSRLLGVLLW